MSVRQRERSPRPGKTFEVGYGKPPKEHQFRKGQSGNPKGRPKGSRSMQTIITDKLNERVAYTQNGQRKTATRREVFSERLINDAMIGKPNAVNKLLQLEADVSAEKESSGAQLPTVDEIDAHDRAILETARTLGILPSGDPA